MQLPDPVTKTYNRLVVEIKEKGEVKIPQFQRNFVWSLKKSADLLDSIVKGYPIGTFIFWRTKVQLRNVRNIGNINLPKHKDGEYVNYVLDGQQRLTSWFAAIKGIDGIERESGQKDDFSKIYINLASSESDTIVTTEVEEEKLIKHS